MYTLRSGSAAPSVSSQRPQSEETHDSDADASVSLSPPILSPQVTSSEAMRILASQEMCPIQLLCVAGTLLSLGTEVLAQNHAPQHIRNPSLSYRKQ